MLDPLAVLSMKRPLRTIGINRSWKLLQADYHVALDPGHLAHVEVREHPRLVYVNGDSPTGFRARMAPRNSLKFATDPTLHVRASFVTTLALQVAAYVGFAEFYFLGLDLDGDHFDGSPAAAGLAGQLPELRDCRDALAKLGRKVRVYGSPDSRAAKLWPLATAEEVLGTLNSKTAPGATTGPV